MSTLKGTTMHPRCRHIGACWDHLNVDFSSSAQVKILLQRELGDCWISNYVSRALGLARKRCIRESQGNTKTMHSKRKSTTFIHKIQKVTDAKIQSKFNFELLKKKKFKFLGFHGVVLVKTFPLMYQSLM